MSLVAERPKLLEAGDHLTPAEFDALYTEDYEGKVELIDGVVFVPSPARIRSHGRPAAWLAGLALAYVAGKPLDVVSDGSIRFPDGSRVQPDVMIIARDADLLAGDYLVGPPIMAMEVAASTASYDLHEKKDLYRRNGVAEYVVWRVLDDAIDLFRLERGEYARAQPDPRGLLVSMALPGFIIPAPELVTDDIEGALARLREAMTSS